MGRQSRLDTELTFDEDYWVVSIVNTGKATDPQSQLFDGHNAILVEGIKKVGPSLNSVQLFIGYYSIGAIPVEQDEKEGSFQQRINIKGIIHKILVDEKTDYDPNRTYNYQQSYCKLVEAEKAKQMIQSIKRDQQKTEAAKRGEGQYLPYQSVGLDSLFSKAEKGHNCSSWCADKMNIALYGINEYGEPNEKSEYGKKPSFTAGGYGRCVLS
ncbi:MAG: hypothetical protein K0U12_00230 [Gammaproteobacteria bacterium]|nr:hypothetical protein [Gammaproteobacteria bacterium]